MNRKNDDIPANKVFPGQPAAAETPARDRGGRMLRPAAMRPDAVKSGQPATSASQEKNLEALGRMLKTKREINGLTRRDVVVKIKIPLDQLEAIEEGRLSSLPPVFAKGFLRAYANELGLDAEALLDDYRKMTGGFKNEPASREPLAQRYVETSVGSNGWRPCLRLVVIGVLVIAAIAAAAWLWPGFQTAVTDLWPFGGDEAVETADGGPSPEPGGENMLEPPASVSDVPLPPRITGTLSQPAPENPGASDSATLAAAPPTLSTPASLTLTSTRDRAWAEVVVDGGQPEFFWFGKAGESAKVVAGQYIVVTSGTANALSVLWDGQDELGLLDAGLIARVRFPKY